MTHNDVSPDDGADLRAHLARVVTAEPPFEMPLDEAVAAAVRGGRRRRSRVMASRGLTLVACAAVVGGTFLVVRPGGSPAPVAESIGTAVESPAASSPPCVEDVTEPLPCDDGGGTGLMIHDKPVNPVHDVSPAALVPLAKAIADGKGEDVYLLLRRQNTAGIPTVVVDASGVAGAYEVTVSVIGQEYDTASWTRSCSPARTDDKPCKVELAEHDRTATSVAFSDGSGRASLTYAQDAGPGRTLLVNVDNYVEQRSVDKTVGPTWKQAGLTPARIAEAVSGSGLLG